MKMVPSMLLLLCLGCTTIGGAGAVAAKGDVRYVNLRLIVDSLVADDEEWKALSARMADLRKKLGRTDSDTVKSPGASSGLTQGEIAVLEKKEGDMKRRLYPLIERAVKAVARRNDFVLVLNSTDVLYSDENVDITGEVLSEARSMKMRDDPLSR